MNACSGGCCNMPPPHCTVNNQGENRIYFIGATFLGGHEIDCLQVFAKSFLLMRAIETFSPTSVGVGALCSIVGVILINCRSILRS